MRGMLSGVVTVTALAAASASSQVAPRTLVAVWAHADDEVPVGPILARYAREGAQVYMIIVTDGAQGASHTTIPRGPELVRVRAEEARCSAEALGAHPPILLGFPDGALGSFTDPTLLYRLTERLHSELQRLRPDALLTWGPDGGGGHPDHRMVSTLVTQLVRAGAPSVPERLFYAFIPVEGFRAVYPSRGAPLWLVPQAKYLGSRISFSREDADAARRSMECHKTQYSDDVVRRVSEMMKGTTELRLSAFSTVATDDLFR